MPLHKDDPKSVGGYRLLDRLGAGGMGAVYRGRSRSGREVAVKVVHAQYAEDPVFRTRFRQEIEAVRKVSGAFTAPVVDADPEAVRPWMATQYVPGLSLAARIRDRGPLRGTELRQLALGLVEALHDIHRSGVVHRDLKPANVLMAEDGPRVIDFGISRAAENHNTLTETGQMIGTPPFMSPEQLTDARTVGPASDVFSLGALLVYAVTGRGPFDADSPYLTAYRVVHDEPVLDGVAQPLRAILERCLAKEPADRPEPAELAREFAAALPKAAEEDAHTVTLRADEVAVVRTRPEPAAGPGALTDGRRRSRVRPLWATAGTVGALALGLTGYLLLGPGPGDDGTRTAAGSATSAPARWAALPTGWKPWQTTVYATAAHGVRKGIGVDDVGMPGRPECEVYEGAVHCAGDGILPLRLDALTGRAVWRADVLPPATGEGSYLFSLLGVADDAVLVEQEYRPEDGDDVVISVAALDSGTGKRLWHRTVNTGSVRPHLSGGLVITPDDSGRSVTARSPRTGTRRWTAPLPQGLYCDWANTGEELYLQCGPHLTAAKDMLILGLDRADGSTRRLTVPNRGVLAGMFEGRLLFVGPAGGDEGPFSWIRLVDPETGRAGSTELAEDVEGNVTFADGTLWFATSSGQVTAVSARTGKRLWRTPTSLEQPSGVTHDPRARVVYLCSASGRVAALDTRKGTPLWETLPRAQRVTNQGWSASRVLLHNGALVVATADGDVFTLDPAHPDRKPATG
ncbi:serine/threonine-protein kinase [Streptomyces viridochromogenes]|uniref:Putative Serine/threonine protein kinase n=1 Tax=Streptomyces viridochromogenes Tue57 TaxID=1160705 RepID=L8P980_STRVR|nr:serine/threonine-protein kinase [Streptomyces viridochromogenes]ELS52664.1 putative Serine/threonine protein kinase [Streptomyces viridochromogenes Tue57]